MTIQEEQFDIYTVAEWMRDHPGEQPDKCEPPTVSELASYERDALNISMTTGSIGVRYFDFISERIMTLPRWLRYPGSPSASAFMARCTTAPGASARSAMLLLSRSAGR